jgi:non-specific serine/threonine protein kinase
MAEFDEARSELRIAGLVVELEPRPLQILLQLLRHPDEVVTREELFEVVWANRPTVDNVLANAVAKLRKALGADLSRCLVTLPKLGYRLLGPVQRMATGRRHVSQLELEAGMPVPGRGEFVLERQLAPSRHSEVWLARHTGSGALRVYKFSTDGERLSVLKRETTLCRVLRESLGERNDLVQVIDWNFESPPFYLECEYGGPNLAQWAAEDPGLAVLREDERIGLFLQIADVVSAAHGIGVLHKDLKPANVLVETRPEGPRIRITDFGSGGLLQPARLEELGITALGFTVTQVAAADTSGTLLYLAPEVLSGQAPTVQSDVYALGLMLYQLLIGDLRRPLAPGWETLVADEILSEDIALATDGSPHRRLSSVGVLCERLRQRGTRRIELEARRDAARRDEQQALRAGRARARRPWMIAAGVTLAAGLGVSLWALEGENLARREAQRQADLTQAVNRFLIDEFIRTADPNVGGSKDLSVVDAVRGALPHIDRDFANRSPDVQGALHLAMQKSLSQLSDPTTALAEADKALAAFDRTEPRDHAGLVESRIWRANDLSRLGKYAAAAATLEAASRELPAVKPRIPELDVRLLQVRSMIAADQVHFQEGYDAGREALRLAEAEPSIPESLRDTLRFALADSEITLGMTTQAEHTLRDLIRRQDARLGPADPQTAYSRVLLANDLVAMRRFDEAEGLILPAIDILHKAWGERARRSVLAESVLASVRAGQARYAEAEALYVSLHDRTAAAYGETNQAAISFLDGAGANAEFAGDAAGAERWLRSALKSAHQILAEDNPQVEHLKYRLAVSLIGQGQRPRAEEAGQLLEHLDPAVLAVAEQRSDWNGRLAYARARLDVVMGRMREAAPLLAVAEREARGQSPADPDLPVGAIARSLAVGD